MESINRKSLPKQSIPLVAIDKSLDRLNDKIAFPEKLKKANKMLRTAKIPAKK